MRGRVDVDEHCSSLPRLSRLSRTRVPSVRDDARSALLATLLVAVATDHNRFASAYTQEGGAYRFPTGSNELHRAKYGDFEVDVATEVDLRAAMEDPHISEISDPLRHLR